MYLGTTLVLRRGLGDLLLLDLDGLLSSFFSLSLILSSLRLFRSISSSSFLLSLGDLSLMRGFLLRLATEDDELLELNLRTFETRISTFMYCFFNHLTDSESKCNIEISLFF